MTVQECRCLYDGLHISIYSAGVYWPVGSGNFPRRSMFTQGLSPVPGCCIWHLGQEL
jgi:hypothetical protein